MSASKLAACRRAFLVSLLCAAALSGCVRETDAFGDGSAADGGHADSGGKEPAPGVDGGEPPVDEDDVSVTSAALVELPGCVDVDKAVREAAKRAVRKLMDEQRQDSLDRLREGQCPSRYGWADAGVSAGPTLEDSTGGGSGPSAVSETNNQVKGVDEADFVKNDDGYIYVLADGALQILDAWPAADAHLVSRTVLPHTPKRMFVTDDRALVFMSKPMTRQTQDPYDSWWYDRGECTYGYDCDFTGDGNATLLELYDITDRGAPKRLRTLELSGSYLSARRVGTAVHMMVYDEPELLRTLSITPQAIAENGVCTGLRMNDGGWEESFVAEGDIARAKKLYAELEEANLVLIDKAPLAHLVGFVKDRIEGKKGVERDHCHGFYDSPLPDGTSLLSLVSLDMVDDRPTQSSTIISRAGASYASGSAYYVSVRQNSGGGYWYDGFGAEDEASTIHKFAIADNGNVYAASGIVKGRVLNQFSMDEFAGDLRIATTSGHLPSPEAHSTLSILKEKDGALVLRGQIDDIAPSEDIRSARFVGERGYVVTFKKTDPLFVFDLSDPDAPKTVGELKIPGFSTYMHPLDEGHLLTIGFDAADQGDFAFFQGLQLQVFDVTNPVAPKLAHKETIGTRGSSSEAATNHLAFSYFGPKETLAVPITVCDGSSGTSSDYGTMTFSGLKLYHVTSDEGFSLTGDVAHPYVDPYDDSGEYGVGASCSTWWSQAQSVVKRTVFMDDFVYSISEHRVKVSDLRDLSHDVADVALVAE